MLRVLTVQRTREVTPLGVRAVVPPEPWKAHVLAVLVVLVVLATGQAPALHWVVGGCAL